MSLTRRSLLRALPALVAGPRLATVLPLALWPAARARASVTADDVRTVAGIVVSAPPGVDYANLTPGLEGATVPSAALQILSRGEAAAAAVSGDGSSGDPYVIRDRDWTGLASNAFSWIDPDADYHVDLVNCRFGLPADAAVQQIYCEISPVDPANNTSASRLRVRQCLSQTSNVTTAGLDQCHLEVRRGLCEVIAHTFRDGRTHPVQKTGGDDARILLKNCEFVGIWRGAMGFVANLATGGSIDLQRVTFDCSGAKHGFWLTNDCEMRCVRVDIANDQAVGNFLSSNGGITGENLVRRKIFYNCRFRSRSTILFADTWAWQNMTFERCEFIGSDDLSNAGQRLVLIGPTNIAETGNSEGLDFSWCRFRKRNVGDQVRYTPTSGNNLTIGDTLTGQTSGYTGMLVADDGSMLTVESTDGKYSPGETLMDEQGQAVIVNEVHRFQSPGNECIDLYRTRNCTIEYCWTDEAGEDAYELHYPREGNVIRYCGGDAVHNQMVDVFSNTPLPYASSVLVHDIWGSCGGEGLIITNVSNVEAFNILTDSSSPIGGALPSVPQANVVIETRFAQTNGQPNDCYIHGEISPPNLSANGTPIAEIQSAGALFGGVNDTASVFWAPDTDGDGVLDVDDNCTLEVNADQRDTNGDGFGNLCDADFNGNGIVDPSDFGLMKSRFGQTGFPDQDLDGNGIVDPGDFSRLKQAFGGPPGPSGELP